MPLQIFLQRHLVFFSGTPSQSSQPSRHPGHPVIPAIPVIPVFSALYSGQKKGAHVVMHPHELQ